MYTRRGDGGSTSLYGSKRVRKDDPRVEAYGTLDELNTVIGEAASTSSDADTVSQLQAVQRLLFVAGGDIATELSSPQKVPRISAADTLKLENMTDDLAAKLPTLDAFILPGGGETGAKLQLARAVCRRAERRVVSASAAEELNPALVPFLNRLSSYLFNLSRWANKLDGKKEESWKGASPG